ncbi:MAG: DM13 domain-containing protein [Acidimicrobiia bacterium]|nr:DM13 domain-containing protein [Acidimicrobiia bacterium]
MKRLFGWIRSHKVISTGALAVTVMVLVGGLIWFQPQKLFVDRRVEETLPQAGEPGAGEEEADGPAAIPTTTVPPQPVVVSSGDFVELDHAGTGRADLIRLPDGLYVVRFEDLDVSNGPDLRVILSTSELVSDGGAYDEDFVDLGALKGNVGSQNYEIPPDVDVSRYHSVVIWCRRFNSSFNAAPIGPVT